MSPALAGGFFTTSTKINLKTKFWQLEVIGEPGKTNYNHSTGEGGSQVLTCLLLAPGAR